MSEFKYKVGDKVLIKSLDWYNKNKNEHGNVDCGFKQFTYEMSKFCGQTMIITNISSLNEMTMDMSAHYWTDGMIEGLVEEETKPKFKVGDKVITDTNMKGKIIEVVEEYWYRVEFEPHNGIPQPNGVVPEESMSLMEEEIKPKFKVGDKITNGEITFTILTLSSDRYGAEDTFGECGSVYFKSQDEWKIVEDEMKSEDGLLDEYEELTDRAFKGGYEKCKSDIELNGFQLPDGYIFKDENGNVINATKIVLEKKKKEYPKTYEECCEIVKVGKERTLEGEIIRINNYKIALLESFQKLLICRDAYWEIAGEEMCLDKPWEPDWTYNGATKYCIGVSENKIQNFSSGVAQYILAFPTEEMRDAFYENFKELIGQCKELL